MLFRVSVSAEKLHQQLAETCNEADLNRFALRVAAGEDPKSLPTYKPVSKIKLQRPTRGQVIMWSRKVRAETFNTKKGRDLIKRSYIETGMMKDDDGQYWNALKIDARKRTCADALLKMKEGKKSLKRAKTKGKMADFGDMISNLIEFGMGGNELYKL